MITLDCRNCKEIVRNLKDKRIRNIHTSSIKSYTHKWNTHINILIIYLLYIYVCIQNISKQNNKYLKSCTLFACATLPPPTLSSYDSLSPPASPNENVHFVRRFCKSRSKQNKQLAMTQQINLNLCKIFTKLIRYNI